MGTPRANQAYGPAAKRAAAVASTRYRVHPRRIFSTDRTADVAAARRLVAWLLRQHGMSFPAIGKILGRDHSTAIRAVQHLEHEARTRPWVPSFLEAALTDFDLLQE